MAEWLGENNTIAQSSVLTITVLQGAFRQSGVPNIAHYDLPRLPTVAWPAQSVILSVCLSVCLSLILSLVPSCGQDRPNLDSGTSPTV